MPTPTQQEDYRRLVRRLIEAERAGRTEEAAGLRVMVADEQARRLLRPVLAPRPCELR